MKKKFRDITVDGVKYGWKNDYGNTTIWKDKNTIIFRGLIKENGKEVFPITPQVIERVIREKVL